LKNLTVQNIQNIVRIVAKSIAPSTGRVITIPEADPDKQGESSGSSQCDDGLLGLGPESRVGTGDEGLDEVLGGGLRTGTLTEISGESYVDPPSFSAMA
jgi:DNA repair protein RAD57